MTQAGRSWQIRVPMGGTLHRDRSNSRRSLSTTRQENRETRATRGMQNKYDGSMCRRSMATGTFE
jgi:hypothetical protein